MSFEIFPKTFMIWDPDNSEEAEAKERSYLTYDPSRLNPDILASEAARFAEHRWSDNDYPESSRVNIRIDGELFEFECDAVPQEPIFTPKLIRRSKPKACG